MTPSHHFRLSQGAEFVDRNRVRFRLWAPAQSQLRLEIKGATPQAMNRLDGGWFELEIEAQAGTAYRYRLENGLCVPDPASRGQLGDLHGPSVVVDPQAFDWHHADWTGRPWHDTVIYELHVGAFGGFREAARQLPRLRELGVTAVELMPIAAFPGRRNWGYDGVLPFAPDDSYGRPEDLKTLIEAAHGLGLMMFLDVVYNHFGPDGNYLASYAPQFFRDDLQTPWGPAIDFRQPVVRRFFTENVLYWLMEYRFDGLRFDAVHAIADRGDWLNETQAAVEAAIEPGRHVHLMLENDANEARFLEHGYAAQWNDDAHHAFHVLLTGERDGYYADYADRPASDLARCLKEGFAYQGEMSRFRGEPRGTVSAGLAPYRFILFLQNHDQIGNRALGERLTLLADPQALEAAIALQLLAPQIPLLFMGEEFACRSPFLFFTDHRPDLAEATREGRKREFQSFTQFSGIELPDPNAPATFEASIPQPDRDLGEGRLSLYRRLLALRHAAIVPRLDGARAESARALKASVVARWRMGDGALLTLAANFGAEAETTTPFSDPLLFALPSAGVEDARNGRLAPRSMVATLGPPS